MAWGRELDGERIWALADYRHVFGSLEANASSRPPAPHASPPTQSSPPAGVAVVPASSGNGIRKSRIEALRYLARRVWRLLISPEVDISMTTVDSQRDVPAPQIAAAA